MENKVSVIIPIFNSQKFLSESIRSVLSQSYKNIEIIAIDDGSTDDSLSILNRFKEDIIIIHQKNQGLSEALNTGIKKMTGKWFKWFSPDDILYPNAIEELVNFAKDKPNTIVYSNWDIIDEKGRKLRTFSETNYNNLDVFDFNVRLLDGQQINVNTTLVPSDIVSQGTLMRKLVDPVLVDYDFFLRVGLILQTKFLLIEKPLIKFRIHQDQLSKQKITTNLKNLEVTKQEILSKLSKKTQNLYLNSLKNYRKKKSITRKSMESGLKIISTLLPSSTTDKLLVFYLNKIRRKR